MLTRAKLLKSKIARRVLIMFIGCALIPIILLVVLSYIKISNYLVEQNKNHLQQEAKAYGMYLYDRIIQIETLMRFASLEIGSSRNKTDKSINDAAIQELEMRFKALSWFADADEHQFIVGRMDRPPKLNDAEITHIKTDKSVLKIQNKQDTSPRMLIYKLINANNFEGGLLVGEIDLKKLWGLDSEDALPLKYNLLIFDHSKELLIGNKSTSEAFQNKIQSEMIRSDANQLVWRYNNQTIYTSVQPIFLRFHFLLPKITITFSQNRNDLLVAIDQFVKIFWLIAILTLVVVIFLSIKFIQKTFKPLEKLYEGTQRVTRGDLKHIIPVGSRDEFEGLSESFNAMIQKLNNQFEHLRMLAETGLITTQSLLVGQIIGAVIDLMANKLDFKRGIILLREREPFQIGVANAFGYKKDLVEKWQKKIFYLNDPNCKEYFVIASNLDAPLIINHISDTKDHLSKNAMEYAIEMGVRAFLYVPILYQNQNLGSFVLENPKSNKEITQADLDLLIGMAAHAGGAIFNALTFKELQQKEEALNRSHQDLELRIHERTAELSQRNLELSEEILKRSRAEEEMKSAKEESDRANRVKSIFLANMSHELRTPLNHIIGFTELVLDKHFGGLNEKQFEYLSDVHHSSQHLLSLINDILDLAKVESGKQELRLADVNLKLLLENSLVMVKEKALKHMIRMSLNAIDLPESISVDERMLKQVIYNLLSNAIKFTPDKGEISVTAQPCEIDVKDHKTSPNQKTRGIKISVTDTGAGLKQEDLDRIFNPFSQAENTTISKSKGTGLGLSLSKNLVELHGGKIWAESEGLGKGATFRIVIPI